MPPINASLTLVAAGVMLATSAPAQNATSDAATKMEARCTALANRTFGSDLAITGTRHISNGSAAPRSGGVNIALPSHCLLSGIINKRVGAGGKTYGIGFQLALPDEWNGRFLLQGGGGLNGSIQPPTGPVAAGNRPALARGFAVVSHDSGHTGAVFDDSFLADQRAALDFAERSVLTVTMLAKEITSAFYGAPIFRSYMTGCSTGGREGMLASQRYPELFDGIVVGAPAMRTADSNLAIEYSGVQFNLTAPRDVAGLPVVNQIFSAADRRTILDGLLKQCDALDGLSDGMIMNVAQCHFEPSRLQCSGAKRDDCLNTEQADAMERAFAGPKDKAGYPIYAPVPYDTGIVDTEAAIAGYLPSGKAGPFGPASRALEIDIDARIHEIRNRAWQRLTDTAYWTNLNSFLDRGGKIMFFHGVSDPWFSPYATWDYWQRAAETNGSRWSDASRLYMNPGMSHCGGGNAHDRFDLLTPLMEWVEKGDAPATIPSWRSSAPDDQRPLCPYPSFAQYVRGDGKHMASFACRSPTG